MATKAEKAALAGLLIAIEDLSSWLDDTSYPRKSRQVLQTVLRGVYDTFELTEPCAKCAGCGQVANTTDQEPWQRWLDLPVQSGAAVVMGLVKPMACPVCGGTGQQLRAEVEELHRSNL